MSAAVRGSLADLRHRLQGRLLQEYIKVLASMGLIALDGVQGGCIIRAAFLDDIYQAYKRDPALENLMMDKEFGMKLVNSEKAWRSVVTKVCHQRLFPICLNSCTA